MPEGYRTETEVLFEEGPRRRVRTTRHTPVGSLTSVTESGFTPGDPIVSVCTEPMVKGPDDWRTFLRMQQDWNEHAEDSEFGAVAEAREGGGYILGTADEVPADTTVEKLKVIVDTVAAHGRY